MLIVITCAEPFLKSEDQATQGLALEHANDKLYASYQMVIKGVWNLLYKDTDCVCMFVCASNAYGNYLYRT